jgi:EAL domain-containing protein (putative c-di-GMP-specific phosphodiesterase class I)
MTKALHRAKAEGGNRWITYNPNMNIDNYRNDCLRRDLHFALERNEFFLLYQARMEVVTNSKTSAEALIRWRHPDWGVISPAEFIHLAEEMGLILSISNWVLQTVCKQINLWREKGIQPMRIALNMSSKQLMQRNLVQKMGSIIEKFDVFPRDLELELTETSLIGTEQISVLNGLKDAGYKISIDDFGTGYSSLQLLKRF